MSQQEDTLRSRSHCALCYTLCALITIPSVGGPQMRGLGDPRTTGSRGACQVKAGRYLSVRVRRCCRGGGDGVQDIQLLDEDGVILELSRAGCNGL